MNRGLLLSALSAALCIGSTAPLQANDVMLDLNALSYVGAFRVSYGTYGDGRTGFARGVIAVDPSTNSFFMTGNSSTNVAQFTIPELSDSTDITELAFTGPPIQNFIEVYDRAPTGNPQIINAITGMKVVDGQLITNGIITYDAAGIGSDTTVVIRDAYDFESSEVTGFTRLSGKAHSAGWMSPIPTEYQSALGKDYISGYSSSYSIDGRLSIGPSAFTFDIDQILDAANGETIAQQPVIDYTMFNRIGGDKHMENLIDGVVQDNDIWTEVSEAFFGMIVPGTSTYFTIGNSGGHRTGVFYKQRQFDTDRLCAGFCPREAADANNFAWLFDVDDMIAAKNGNIIPHDIRPYEYGPITAEFEDINNDGIRKFITGADYDYENNLLYVSMQGTDPLQNRYEPVPLIVVYRFNNIPPGEEIGDSGSGGECHAPGF